MALDPTGEFLHLASLGGMSLGVVTYRLAPGTGSLGFLACLAPVPLGPCRGTQRSRGWDLTLAPDGQTAYLFGTELRLMRRSSGPADGGAPTSPRRRVRPLTAAAARAPIAFTVEFTPNCEYAEDCESSRSAVFLTDARGRKPRLLADRAHGPAFSNRGDRVALNRDSRQGIDQGIFAADLPRGRYRRITRPGYGPSWSPRDSRIAFWREGSTACNAACMSAIGLADERGG